MTELVTLNGVWRSLRIDCGDESCEREHYDEGNERYHYEDGPVEGRTVELLGLEPGDRLVLKLENGTVVSADATDVENRDALDRAVEIERKREEDAQKKRAEEEETRAPRDTEAADGSGSES